MAYSALSTGPRAVPSASSPLTSSEREQAPRTTTTPLLPIPQGNYPDGRQSPNVFWWVVRSILRNSNPHQQGAHGRRRSSSSCINNKRVVSLRSMSYRAPHVRFLRLVWCLMLFLGEYGSFWVMVHRCRWPENSSWDQSNSAVKDRYRVAVLSDPQLTDWASYKQSGLLLALVETYTDIFMRRSFRHLHSSLRPDAVIFVGDLNDGGRQSFGEVFEKNRQRFFETVFRTKSTAWNPEPVVMDLPNESNAGRDTSEGSMDNNIKIAGQYHQTQKIPADAMERERVRNAGRSLRLYVAGNHDVGFGDTLVRWTMIRHKKVYGSVNYEIDVGNHTFVVLDTLAFSSQIPDIREESQQFIDGIKEGTHTLPRILFTHVPLFRWDTTYCGIERESKQLIINRGGDQYQNMVDSTLSKEILEAIQPDMIFSGDDHDWCEVAHSYEGNTVRGPFSGTAPEVTLPTFSFAQGIYQAGFVMLSLYNPQQQTKNNFPLVPSSAGLPTSLNQSLSSSGTTLAGSRGTEAQSIHRPSGDATFAYDECMLPNQLLIYSLYGGFFALTLSYLLIRRYRWMLPGRRLLSDHSLLLGWSRSMGLESEVDPEGQTTATSMPTNAAPADATTVHVDDLTQEDLEDDESLDEWDADLRRREEALVLDPLLSTSTSKQQRVWPLMTRLYWAMIGWDVVNVAIVAAPFYILLFIISLL